MEVLFCLVLVIGKLIADAYQGHKANQYADKVVRRYKGTENFGVRYPTSGNRSVSQHIKEVRGAVDRLGQSPPFW